MENDVLFTSPRFTLVFPIAFVFAAEPNAGPDEPTSDETDPDAPASVFPKPPPTSAGDDDTKDAPFDAPAPASDEEPIAPASDLPKPPPTSAGDDDTKDAPFEDPAPMASATDEPCGVSGAFKRTLSCDPFDDVTVGAESETTPYPEAGVEIDVLLTSPRFTLVFPIALVLATEPNAAPDAPTSDDAEPTAPASDLPKPPPTSAGDDDTKDGPFEDPAPMASATDEPCDPFDDVTVGAESETAPYPEAGVENDVLFTSPRLTLVFPIAFVFAAEPNAGPDEPTSDEADPDAPASVFPKPPPTSAGDDDTKDAPFDAPAPASDEEPIAPASDLPKPPPTSAGDDDTKDAPFEDPAPMASATDEPCDVSGAFKRTLSCDPFDVVTVCAESEMAPYPEAGVENDVLFTSPRFTLAFPIAFVFGAEPNAGTDAPVSDEAEPIAPVSDLPKLPPTSVGDDDANDAPFEDPAPVASATDEPCDPFDNVIVCADSDTAPNPEGGVEIDVLFTSPRLTLAFPIAFVFAAEPNAGPDAPASDEAEPIAPASDLPKLPPTSVGDDDANDAPFEDPAPMASDTDEPCGPFDDVTVCAESETAPYPETGVENDVLLTSPRLTLAFPIAFVLAAEPNAGTDEPTSDEAEPIAPASDLPKPPPTSVGDDDVKDAPFEDPAPMASATDEPCDISGAFKRTLSCDPFDDVIVCAESETAPYPEAGVENDKLFTSPRFTLAFPIAFVFGAEPNAAPDAPVSDDVEPTAPASDLPKPPPTSVGDDDTKDAPFEDPAPMASDTDEPCDPFDDVTVCAESETAP